MPSRIAALGIVMHGWDSVLSAIADAHEQRTGTAAGVNQRRFELARRTEASRAGTGDYTVIGKTISYDRVLKRLVEGKAVQAETCDCNRKSFSKYQGGF